MTTSQPLADPVDETTIIAYAHPACPQWHPVKQMLKRSDVPFEYINIHEDLDARNRVREINNGYESVPTLVFPDGSTLTEPGAGELRTKLQSLGYDVPISAWLAGNAFYLLMTAALLVALLRAFGIF